MSLTFCTEDNFGAAPVGDGYEKQWKALSAWFLGPRAENWDTFIETYKEIFHEHVQYRNNYFPSDPAYITDEIRSSPAYQTEIRDMEKQLMEMQEKLQGSVPFYSPRYQGHMLWDITMPACLGYMGAMLFNQNNVDSAASPVTTLYEKKVGLQLCDMLGYNICEEKTPLAWGHITCGGSMANMEAVWAARNIKFIPLALRAVLLDDDTEEGALSFIAEEQVMVGLDYQVNVFDKIQGKTHLVPIGQCTTWELLNLDIDVICDLVKNVLDEMQESMIDESLTIDKERFAALVEKEGIMSLGVYNFLQKHEIEETPVYTVPANCHYSWPKAGTVLGLGSDALIPIQLDRDFRQSVKHLREKLEEFSEKEIAVLSVTVVMGSTEESAVDPIKEIYELREEFKAKGLNFAILADGAWGGYFKTMLIGKVKDTKRRHLNHDDFMPYCELSPYVRTQYEHIQLADTITIDPHKSGFCPYPGGALCYRNGKMRFPIALFHPEVFHGDNDPTMGVYGIEGSKPGAAPAGILMSHNVIGLSNRGYGRILGQCTATSKLFYTMWLTVARDDDPFVCVPLQDIPEYCEMDQAKAMIKEKIAYKPITEVYKDKEVVRFLTDCGPDTMINTFVVNFRNNEDVDLANQLQLALSDAMNVFVGTNPNRVPIIIMQSGLDAEKHGEGLRHFKEKAGLNVDNKNLNVMVNTSMNPWQSNESIFAIGDLFRLNVLNCIGRVKDAASNHTFHLSGSSIGIESIFLEYVTDANNPLHQYQVSVKVEADDDKDKAALSKYLDYCCKNHLDVLLESNMVDYEEKKGCIPNLHNILHSTTWGSKLRVRLVNHPRSPTVSLKVLDIPRYQRLDMSSSTKHPLKKKYFLYGDSTRVIMSHVISKLPDYQQTVVLSTRPHSLTETMLEQGVEVQVEGAEEEEEEETEPLSKSSYKISFIGELHATINTTINIKKRLWYKKISSPSVL